MNFKNLFGTFAPKVDPNQPDADPLFNRREAGWNAAGGALQGLGVGLMTGDWAQAMAVNNSALDDYRRMKREKFTAQQLMEQAAENKRKREEEAARKQQMEDAISKLSPDQQGLARIAPEKFFGAQIDSLFGQPDTPALVQEYLTAKQEGFGGTLADWKQLGRAGAPIVNINNGEIPDKNLRDSLDKAEGGLWTEYKKAGAVSGANAQDFAVLDELLKLAPQGPLTGRFAAAFPGVSSAGDAVQSIVKRIAPTLRAPGSGATSDIEYQGMLQSLPALVNQPEANMMILSIMRAKADLNVQRAEVITRYQTGEIDAQTARREIAKLDRVSIMTPEMKKALLGISGDTSGKGDLMMKAPPGVPQEEWDVMSDEDRALWPN